MFRQKKIRRNKAVAVFLLAFALAGCTQNYVPKPRGYFRIALPENAEYKKAGQDLPYSFLISDAARVQKVPNQQQNNWINIKYPTLDATIHLSYQTVNNNVLDLSNDAHKFVYKHTVKAEGIDQKVFYYPEHQTAGIIYQLKGNTASPYQFFVTDSTSHFLRGALYFDARPNQDSLMPLIKYVENDIYKLIETLEWNE